MKISTRGRYAVMAMADMAQQLSEGQEGPFRLSEIASRQEISLNYLEQIFGALRRAGLVESQRGAHGGYHLARDAEKIHIGDVIYAVDEPVDVTRCKVKQFPLKQLLLTVLVTQWHYLLKIYTNWH